MSRQKWRWGAPRRHVARGAITAERGSWAGGGGGGGGGPFTLSLLHYDGADASTTIVDEVSANTPYVAGSGQLDTAFKKFGTASSRVFGFGDYTGSILSAPVDPSSDLTFEFWIYISGVGEYGRVHVGKTHTTPPDVTNPMIRCLFNTDFSGSINLQIHDGTVLAWDTFLGGMSTSTWYHVAFVKEGTTWSDYLNGVRTNTATKANTLTGMDRIGHTYDGGDSNCDEIRLSNIARYSGASFTPPAVAFTLD